MLLKLDGKNYTVSEETSNKLIQLAISQALKIYNEKLPAVAQAFISKMARDYLYSMEKKIYEATHNKQLAKTMRPAKKQDSIEKILELMIGGLKEEILPHATLGISTNNDGEITDFTFELPHKSQTGG